MAKNTRRSKQEEEEFSPLDELFGALSRQIDKVPVGKGKSTAITWSIVAVVLIAVSSVLFHFDWAGTWLPAIIGAPSGLILYLIGLGLVKRTKIQDMEISHVRESYSFKQRLRKIGIGFALYALIFIPLGRYIPYGLGGSLFILMVLTAVTIGRRTEEELAWAKQGVPDPRDLIDTEVEDDYAEEEPVSEPEDTSKADTIYYDEQRGGFGGKLN